MKVLVTGAAGFVGREIVAELGRNGFEVVQLGRTRPTAAVNTGRETPADFFTADITVKENLAELLKLKNLKNIDAVVHSAGLAHQFGNTPKSKFEEVNVRGTENVIELAAALKVKHFVLIGSTAVYGLKSFRGGGKSGNENRIITEETTCQPDTVYAESKLQAENLCREICRQSGLPLTVLRLAPVLGEGNTGNAARLVRAIDTKRFVWVGAGENLKTLIYKKDVAKAVFEILSKKRDGTEIFNLAAPPLALKDFVAEIEKQLHKTVPRIHLSPKPLEMIFRLNEKTLQVGKIKKIAATLEKWLADDIYSAEKIKRVYKFVPPTSIAEALKRQVEWYLREKTKS